MTKLERTPSTTQLVSSIKAADQDFEWYPTTQEILDSIKLDLEKTGGDDKPSILDCGAGDGRSLMFLTKGDRYAIEKSIPLLEVLDPNIFVVGTEFKEQTLIDKKVDVIFCNPPYSEFSEWSTKIINEANAPCIYLVIPSRWADNVEIEAAIKRRMATASIIGSFNFQDADRAARAKINVVKIDLTRTFRSFRSAESRTDPFALWFEDNFKIEISKDDTHKYDLASESNFKDAVENELVAGNGIIAALDKLYQRDLENLINTYRALSDIDAVLLGEMNIDLKSVRGAMQLKISGLKNTYWKELFNNLNKITERLTGQIRESMLDHLLSHTHVDFSAKNAYAIVIWIIKNANNYINVQLTNTVEKITEKASIVLYKSNKRTFGNEEWRYARRAGNLTDYKIDYRIVLANSGGLLVSDWAHELERYSGLQERVYNLINDLRTVATNIGFDTTLCGGPGEFVWESGAKHSILFRDHETGKDEVLFTAKAFKNGNLHIQFNQAFICKLNVEHGRLKGWVKSAKQAAEEMDIPFDIAQESFGSNIKLGIKNLTALGVDCQQ